MKFLLYISTLFIIASCNLVIPDESTTLGKETINDTDRDSSFASLRIEVKNLEYTQVKIQELGANYNGNIYNEKHKDTVSQKELSLFITLPIEPIDSFLDHIVLLEINSSDTSLVNLNSDIKILKEHLKQLQLDKRFVTIKIIIYQRLPQVNHFWRDLGTGLSGAGLALVKFVLLLLKAWPIIIMFLIIGYLAKFRFKAKK